MSEQNEKENKDFKYQGNPEVCEKCGGTEEVNDTLEVPWWDFLCKKCRNPEEPPHKSGSSPVPPVR